VEAAGPTCRHPEPASRADSMRGGRGGTARLQLAWRAARCPWCPLRVGVMTPQPPLHRKHLPRHIRGRCMDAPHRPMAHCPVREKMIASCACSCDSSRMACLSLAPTHVLAMHPALYSVCVCALWHRFSPHQCAQHNTTASTSSACPRALFFFRVRACTPSHRVCVG
jgi:hypothetical protein